MKPARFHYYDRTTIGEALLLVGGRGEDARVLAGGQTLGQMLSLRIVSPAAVITRKIR